jgi:hypothetical protein
MFAHDWLEVSAVGEELIELELLEPEAVELLLGVVVPVAVVGVLVAVAVVGVLVPEVFVVGVVGVVLVLVLVVVAGDAAALTVLVRARAGSWPEISSIVISSQVATNRASALATTRRRMPEIRASRAWRMAMPRARRSDGEGVMSVPLGDEVVDAT